MLAVMKSFKLFIFTLNFLAIIPNIILSAIPLTFYCTRFVPSAVSFNTSIANIALNVSALQGPCVEIASTGKYTNGSSFAVIQITSAEPLCYSNVAGVQDTRGSSVWFMSPQGWVWSGLTTNLNWNLSC
ncbi:14060_t:CDS:1 [Dentiscutata heterogama]|uniref:14060_t:CDS:1 n=1 Tax=Dentiscutata heterogama TaxID=1316150 RepID=A0ACA9L730_9GLOM|nr:14060_t:CDS:1 [Dentiscutata heterogama]